MAQFDLLNTNSLLSIAGIVLLFVIVVIVVGGLALVIYALYFKKDQPKLTLFKINDLKLNMELAKRECPISCLNKKIGFSGDGKHMKSIMGTIKGLRTMATLKDNSGNAVDIMFCTYLPNGENEIIYAIMGKELGHIIFSETDCDGLIGDITLKGINTDIHGKYNYLMSREISSSVITDYLDSKLLITRLRETWENIADITQFAVRCDPQHHKTIEESATTGQSQPQNPQVPLQSQR
jgi:hypothetical protein